MYIQAYTKDGTRPRCSITFSVADSEEEDHRRIDDDTISFLLRGILGWSAMSIAVTCFEIKHEILTTPVLCILTNPALWTTILHCLPRVKQLYLEDYIDYSHRSASGTVDGLSKAIHTTPDLAPALTHIHLKFMPETASQKYLAEAAKKRLAAGHPALSLFLDRCGNIELRNDLRDLLHTHSGGALYLVAHSPWNQYKRRIRLDL